MTGDLIQFALMGKYIGAGLATIGLGGAGIGVGTIAGNFLSGACATLRPLLAKWRTCSSASLSPKLWGSSRSSSLCC